MTGMDLRQARQKTGMTQETAASALGLTQAYLSMLENGRRQVTSRVASKAAQVYELPPTALPLDDNFLPLSDEEMKVELGALGYPGFRYLADNAKAARNPAQLLSYFLDQADLDARVVEALPWMASEFEDMDWQKVVGHAKQHDRQNRLGFVVALAQEIAEKTGKPLCAQKLNEYREQLEFSRLVRQDTLCHDSMTGAERRWLSENRSTEARHWNLLTDLRLDHLSYVPA